MDAKLIPNSNDLRGVLSLWRVQTTLIGTVLLVGKVLASFLNVRIGAKATDAKPEASAKLRRRGSVKAADFIVKICIFQSCLL
jgi:hypothetical protein